MKLQQLYFISLGLLTGLLTGCNEDMENFSNNIYMNSIVPENILVKANIESEERSFQIAMAKPEPQDVSFTIKADPGLISQYEDIYYTSGVESLPENFYSFSATEGRIPAEGIISTPITVKFKDINLLDIDKVYVLPVTITNANISILNSARTFYYVFKGASLINKVANISNNNVYVKWTNPDVVQGMTELTAEALIRPHSFDNSISTLMGIEGKFLFRFGDNSPKNQLQIVTGEGASEHKTMIARDVQLEEWIHIAITYDANAKTIKAYYNGELVAEDNKVTFGPVDWGVEHSDESNGKPRCFWIGYSYNNERWLDADISEVRIWNRVLSAEEISATNHAYEVDPASDGLAVYWKFNDGVNSIKDYTMNGNDATASNPLTWIDVALPAKE